MITTDHRPLTADRPLVEEIIACYGSPLYLYDADTLRATITCISASVPYPGTSFHFASVTNGNIALLRIFRESGWGLHANTPGDAFLGLRAGFDPARIIYTGSNLNRDEMKQMIEWRVAAFNFDSLDQLHLFCEIYSGSRSSAPRLGLRLNLPAVIGESRIGVRIEEFEEAARIAARRGLKVTGIHFYRGTGTNATAAFTDSIAQVLSAAACLPDWQYLDFGGGFGYPYRRDRESFDWEKFGHELSRHLFALDHRIDLIIEPGRAVIAGCGTLIARVVAVKWQGERQIVGVDTSVANIAVLSVHGGHREVAALKPAPGELFTTDVCGNTTFSRDYLSRNAQLPALAEGDLIAIRDVGAYGYAMSSHFLHRPRPAEVLIEDRNHRLIRRREEYDVLIESQIL
ncbi:MAG: decarboxylase [Acidobacteriota bacterium]